MPDASEAGPSSSASRGPSPTTVTRRRSSGTRSARSRPVRPRAASSISLRSDASNLSSGIQQLTWTTGDCFDYVDDDARISAFLHCPICLGPFLDPYASNLCAHTFCKQCITAALAESNVSGDQDPLVAAVNKRCPTCRTAVELSDFQPTALLIKNMVDTLRVRCPNKAKGCDYECERHLLRGHVASHCAYEYVDHDLNEGKRCGCSAKVMRKDWASHGLTCSKRKTSCPTCDAVLCADELQDHSQTCSPEPATCEFCHVQTIKSRLTLHISDECQDAPVLCPHSAFGCSWIGPRRHLQRHSNAAGKSTDRTHLEEECRFEPIKAFFSVFTQHVNELKNENAALKTRVDELEGRQHGQARRLDDCVHSLGSWYRSAGELRTGNLEHRMRGSQVGVDGEWDEFPLDAQNWERSLSQQSFGARQSRAQSASAVSSMDLASWARRQYSDFAGPDMGAPLRSQRSASSNPALLIDDLLPPPRYLAPSTARSMPNSSALGGSSLSPSPSPARDRTAYIGVETAATTRRTASTSLTPIDPTPSTTQSALSPGSYGFPTLHAIDNDIDRSNLDSVISSLTASIAGLSSGLSTLDKRTEEGHIAAVKAGFDAGRVQEEVASLRHGLHAVRMQIHQILMQQQRHALFTSAPVSNMASMATSLGVAAAGREADAGPSGAATGPMREHLMQGSLPMLSPPLMRRWAGLEHTKL